MRKCWPAIQLDPRNRRPLRARTACLLGLVVLTFAPACPSDPDPGADAGVTNEADAQDDGARDDLADVTTSDVEPDPDGADADAAGPDADLVTDVSNPEDFALTVAVVPAQPRTADDLEATAFADGAPLDPAAVVWEWTLDDDESAIDGATVPAAETARDQVWRVIASVATSAGTRSADATVTITNTPPAITSATLSPNAPTRSDALSCTFDGWTDPDDDDPLAGYAWYRVEGESRFRLAGDTTSRSASDLRPGDAIACAVTPIDAVDSGLPVASNVLTIANEAPRIEAVTVAPVVPYDDSALGCVVSGVTDPDDTDVTLAFAWEVDDRPVPGAAGPSLPPQDTGATVVCIATASDPWGGAVSRASEPVGIANRLPSVARVTLDGGSLCGDWTCIASGVVDRDGDETSLAYRWVVGGAEVAATSATLPADAVAPGQSVQCFARATDGRLAIFGPETPSSAIDSTDLPPLVMGPTIRDHGRAGDMAVCALDVTDDCDAAQITYLWTVGGITQVGADEPTFRIPEAPPASPVQCFAVVADESTTLPARPSNVLTLSTTGWDITGNIAGGQFGFDVDVVADLDGDQFAEILVGSPGESRDTARHAGAFFLVGGRDDTDAVPLADVKAGVAGLAVPGLSGDFAVSNMACGPFQTDQCPTIRPPGDIDGWQTGPRGAGLGFSVAGLGDMDGDNLADFVVSAPYEQAGQIWRGRSYVVSGSAIDDPDLLGSVASGINGAGYAFDGECGRRPGADPDHDFPEVIDVTNGDLAGFRVTGLGDVNGDGLDDLAVGAVNSGEADEGTVYVVYGRADGQRVTGTDLYTRGCFANETEGAGGLDRIAGFAIVGYDDGAEANWGRLLAPLGDFDGDGYDDVLVHPGLGVPHTYVVYGGPDRGALDLQTAAAPDATALWHGDFRFNSEDGFSGRLVSGLPAGGGGDVNGDGYDDIAFHVVDFDATAGLSVLFGDPDREAEIDLDGPPGGTRGFVVNGFTDIESFLGDVRILGDVNGDGYDDIALVVPVEADDAGRLWVVFGAADDPEISFSDVEAGSGGFSVLGAPGEQFGWAVAGGDIDGDGLDDVIVGAPHADVGDEADAGRVRIEYGRDFSGAITHYGGRLDDRLVGTASGDNMVGGQGDDTLIGAGGSDVFYGGAGDDIFEIGDDTFRRIRGGAGDDTVRLAASVSAFDFAALGTRIEDVERIALDGQTLLLDRVQVVGLSATSNRLIVDGSRGTVIAAQNDRWRDAGRVTQSGREYITLVDGWAELWLDTRLTTSIPPTVDPVTALLDENTPEGTLLASVAATDPDGDDAGLAWRVDSRDDAMALALDGETGEIRVADASVLDYERDVHVFSAVVEVEDEDGLTQTVPVTFTLVDVNEPPVLLDDAPRWGVEEGGGPEEIIGTLAAYDPDAGDELTFSISDDPDARFAIDPTSGDVTVRQGTALDYETATEHTLTVRVTDAEGLAAETDIAIDVRDRDRIERSASLTASVRDWSLWRDAESAAFDAFDIYPETAAGVPFVCVTWEALGESGHEQTYNFPNIPRFPGFGLFPWRTRLTSSGTVCVEVGVSYDKGAFHADVPFTVDLGFPDEIAPGETIDIDTDFAFVNGGALWGHTPALSVIGGIDIYNFTMVFVVCEAGERGEECETVVDIPDPRDAQLSDGFNLRSESWTAVQGFDDDGDWAAATPDTVVADTAELRIDWDTFLLNALAYLDINTNTGTYRFEGDSFDMRLDYIVFLQELAYVLDSRWDFAMDVRGFDVRVTLEDGSAFEWRLGEAGSVSLPSADDAIYDDGLVAITVDILPVANFAGRLRTTQLVGFTNTVGYAQLTAKDPDGNTLATREVGPVFQDICAVRNLNQTGSTGRGCLKGDDDETYLFEVSGFRPIRLLGAIDVVTP